MNWSHFTIPINTFSKPSIPDPKFQTRKQKERERQKRTYHDEFVKPSYYYTTNYDFASTLISAIRDVEESVDIQLEEVDYPARRWFV